MKRRILHVALVSILLIFNVRIVLTALFCPSAINNMAYSSTLEIHDIEDECIDSSELRMNIGNIGAIYCKVRDCYFGDSVNEFNIVRDVIGSRNGLLYNLTREVNTNRSIPLGTYNAVWTCDNTTLNFSCIVGVGNEENECEKYKPCSNDKGCTDLSVGYKCNCLEGYSGINCTEGNLELTCNATQYSYPTLRRNCSQETRVSCRVAGAIVKNPLSFMVQQDDIYVPHNVTNETVTFQICFNSTRTYKPGDFSRNVYITADGGQQFTLLLNVTLQSPFLNLPVEGYYFFNVPEDSSINTTIASVQKTTQSSACISCIQVTDAVDNLVFSANFGKLDINPISYDVDRQLFYVNGKLLYQDSITAELRIKRYAVDYGSINVTFEIIDVDDPPICENLTIHLPPIDMSVSNKNLTRLNCTDPDIELQYKPIKYSIDSLFADYFTVTEDGLLQVKNSLQRLGPGAHNFNITLNKESLKNQLHVSVHIFLYSKASMCNVTFIHDRPSRWIVNTTYVLQVLCNTSGNNNVYISNILVTPINIFNYVSNRLNATYHTIDMTLREFVPNIYTIQVDIGNVSESLTLTFHVFNPPDIESNEIVYIFESQQKNEHVVDIKASTSTPNTSLIYSIIEGNINNMFSINSSNGSVIINNDLRYVNNDTYYLTIQVKDSRSELTTTTVINIQLLPVCNLTLSKIVPYLGIQACYIVGAFQCLHWFNALALPNITFWPNEYCNVSIFANGSVSLCGTFSPQFENVPAFFNVSYKNYHFNLAVNFTSISGCFGSQNGLCIQLLDHEAPGMTCQSPLAQCVYSICETCSTVTRPVNMTISTESTYTRVTTETTYGTAVSEPFTTVPEPFNRTSNIETATTEVISTMTMRPTTNTPTDYPTTNTPTGYPTTNTPTGYPTTNTPTGYPTTNIPTDYPTTNTPKSYPTTNTPTGYPTTNTPTYYPTTNTPTGYPTTNTPTDYPTTNTPTGYPTTNTPTYYSTTNTPTDYPTTNTPTDYPTTNTPTGYPTTNTPTGYPTKNTPTYYPTTNTPTGYPTTNTPTDYPTTPVSPTLQTGSSTMPITPKGFSTTNTPTSYPTTPISQTSYSTTTSRTTSYHTTTITPTGDLTTINTPTGDPTSNTPTGDPTTTITPTGHPTTTITPIGNPTSTDTTIAMKEDIPMVITTDTTTYTSTDTTTELTTDIPSDTTETTTNTTTKAITDILILETTETTTNTSTETTTDIPIDTTTDSTTNATLETATAISIVETTEETTNTITETTTDVPNVTATETSTKTTTNVQFFTTTETITETTTDVPIVITTETTTKIPYLTTETTTETTTNIPFFTTETSTETTTYIPFFTTETTTETTTYIPSFTTSETTTETTTNIPFFTTETTTNIPFFTTETKTNIPSFTTSKITTETTTDIPSFATETTTETTTDIPSFTTSETTTETTTNIPFFTTETTTNIPFFTTETTTNIPSFTTSKITTETTTDIPSFATETTTETTTDIPSFTTSETTTETTTDIPSFTTSETTTKITTDIPSVTTETTTETTTNIPFFTTTETITETKTDIPNVITTETTTKIPYFTTETTTETTTNIPFFTTETTTNIPFFTTETTTKITTNIPFFTTETTTETTTNISSFTTSETITETTTDILSFTTLETTTETTSDIPSFSTSETTTETTTDIPSFTTSDIPSFTTSETTTETTTDIPFFTTSQTTTETTTDIPSFTTSETTTETTSDIPSFSTSETTVTTTDIRSFTTSETTTETTTDIPSFTTSETTTVTTTDIPIATTTKTSTKDTTTKISTKDTTTTPPTTSVYTTAIFNATNITVSSTPALLPTTELNVTTTNVTLTSSSAYTTAVYNNSNNSTATISANITAATETIDTTIASSPTNTTTTAFSSTLSTSLVYQSDSTKNTASSTIETPSTITVLSTTLGPQACLAVEENLEIKFEKTLTDEFAKADCAKPYIGQVWRLCTKTGVWGSFNLNNCTRPEFTEALSEAQSLNSSSLNSSQVNRIFSTVTESLNNSTQIISGDIKSVMNILTLVANAFGSSETAMEVKTLQAVANISDRLVSADDAWSGVFDQATILLESMEMMTSSALKSIKNETANIATKNIGIKMKTFSNGIDFESAQFQEWEKENVDKISIQSNGPDDKMNYSIILYKNMADRVKIDQALQEKYNEPINLVNKTVNSHIISITVQRRDSNQPVKITFAYLNQTSYENPVCGFLNTSINETGLWSTYGCTTDSNTSDHIVCSCNHLTNFAVLMSIKDGISKKDDEILGIISIVGCSISLFCLTVTIVIYLALWKYVKNDRSVLHINLSLCLIIGYIVFLAGIKSTENEVGCKVVAALLHFFFLAVFFMMLAEGVEIIKSVSFVFTSTSILRYLLVGAYGIPFIIVAISLAVTKTKGYGNNENCWLSIEDGLIWAFVGPVLLIFLVNLIILIIVIRTMQTSQIIKDKSVPERVKSALRSICILSPLLGLAWVFGVLSVNEESVVFKYLFAIFNSLQGLFIFIFQCLLQHQVRDGLRERRRKYKATSFDSGNRLVSSSSSMRRSSESKSNTASKNSYVSDGAYDFPLFPNAVYKDRKDSSKKFQGDAIYKSGIEDKNSFSPNPNIGLNDENHTTSDRAYSGTASSVNSMESAYRFSYQNSGFSFNENDLNSPSVLKFKENWQALSRKRKRKQGHEDENAEIERQRLKHVYGDVQSVRSLTKKSAPENSQHKANERWKKVQDYAKSNKKTKKTEKALENNSEDYMSPQLGSHVDSHKSPDKKKSRPKLPPLIIPRPNAVTGTSSNYHSSI